MVHARQNTALRDGRSKFVKLGAQTMRMGLKSLKGRGETFYGFKIIAKKITGGG